MNIHASLPAIAAVADEIRAILGEDCDELTLWDTLSGETNVDDMVGALIRERVEAEAHEAASRAAADTFAARAKRMSDRRSAINVALGAILDAVGEDKIKHPLGTVSRLAPSKSVEITDERAVPSQLCRQVPDKAAIKAALEAGETVPGAVLSLGKPGISVRTR
jgi:hypothetical protein